MNRTHNQRFVQTRFGIRALDYASPRRTTAKPLYGLPYCNIIPFKLVSYLHHNETSKVMPSITVKNIPESIYKKLKQQAEAHHRSMNSEIIACLERTVEPKRVSSDEILRQARLMRRKVKGSLSSEEIQDAIDQGRP